MEERGGMEETQCGEGAAGGGNSPRDKKQVLLLLAALPAVPGSRPASAFALGTWRRCPDAVIMRAASARESRHATRVLARVRAEHSRVTLARAHVHMRRSQVVGQYELGKVIGAGAFSKVRIATKVGGKDLFAVKIVLKDSIRDIRDLERSDCPGCPHPRCTAIRQPSSGSKMRLILMRMVCVRVRVLVPLYPIHCNRVMREMHVLKNLSHPNVINMHESVEKGSKLYLVLDYAAGGGTVHFSVPVLV